ncbi:MAG: FAD-binding protein [Gammaproteobacteria bacterium]|nr:FAD-binding protein [Gammaproteobacteria bacterium]
MSRLLIVAEHGAGNLNASVAKTLACALELKPAELDVVLFSADGAEAACQQAAALTGVSRVLSVARPENGAPMGAVLAPQVAAMAADYDYVFGPSTTFGKDLMPSVAALAGVPMVTDIMGVEDGRTFVRPTYAGNAVDKVRVPDGLVVATVRAASYKAVGGGGSAPVEALELDIELPTHSRFVEIRAGSSDRPDLQSATKVVSGGRGLGSAENFQVIYSLADKLGAGVGASRAAVDSGFVPNEMQVGQTGKIIAPDLYIAVGISGAIQHLAGIKDAGTIVAINKDPEAPIFEVADIGLVGDLFKLLPEIEAAL